MQQKSTPLQLSYPKGVAMVLCAGLFWSFIPIGVRSFQTADVWQILFYRSAGLLPLIYWLIWHQSNGQPVSAIKSTRVSGLLGSAGLVMAYIGGIEAVRLTSVANAAFLFATAPFIAAVLAWVILREPLRRTTMAALAIALGGIVMMVTDSISLGHWLGDLLALLSALGFAIFAISLRAGSAAGNNINSLPVVFIGGVLAMLCAAAMAGLSNGLSLPLNEVFLALALGVLFLGTGMALCTMGSRVVPAAELALLCMTEVVFAPVWAWLFLHELPNPKVLIGGGIVIFAITLNALSGIRRKPAMGPNL